MEKSISLPNLSLPKGRMVLYDLTLLISHPARQTTNIQQQSTSHK
ncbi:hypothetical protein [[Phormidium ambiguum] IAM M-71]|nr:hypothetical protein [Phormidium ambiguum]